jgi:hypothetical protein
MYLNIILEFLKSYGPYLISILALIVSCISPFLTWRRDRRDRPILKARCQLFYLHPEGVIPLLRVVATNVGQRPIALISLGAKHPGKANWIAFRLEDRKLVLNQNESYEYEVTEGHFILKSPTDSLAKSLWFEDTAGKRHHIKHSEKYIRILHKHRRLR